jgi:AraC-like DNA-binding protein
VAAQLVGVGVDGLVLAARHDPHAAVLGVGAIERDPRSDQGLPVGEIAVRSGFKSVYHFSRRVKEQTGSAPTALRRERWQA